MLQAGAAKSLHAAPLPPGGAHLRGNRCPAGGEVTGPGGVGRSRCSAAADPDTSGVPTSGCPEPRACFTVFQTLFSSSELRSTSGLQQLRRVQVNAAAACGALCSGRGCSLIVRSPGCSGFFWSVPAASGRCPDPWYSASLSSRVPTAALLPELETELRASSVLVGRRGGDRIYSTALGEAANQ